MIKRILDVAKSIKNDRSLWAVNAKVVEEVGELSTEVAIANGESYKTPGTDGVIGEAVDVIIAAVDLIYLTNPTITEEELLSIAIPKLQKWQKLAQDKTK